MYNFLSYTFILNILSHSKIQVEEYTYVNTYHQNNGKNDIRKEYRLQKYLKKIQKK